MGRHFTHYWKNKTWRWHMRNTDPGEHLRHAASNLFRQRGVGPGDTIYVVTVIRGELYLCAKMRVGRVCGEGEAARALGWEVNELWKAKDHAVAAADTPMRFDLPVPPEIVEQLVFVSRDRPRPTFEPGGELDKQTLRGVRELRPESAALLDKLLPPMKHVRLRTWSMLRYLGAPFKVLVL